MAILVISPWPEPRRSPLSFFRPTVPGPQPTCLGPRAPVPSDPARALAATRARVHLGRRSALGSAPTRRDKPTRTPPATHPGPATGAPAFGGHLQPLSATPSPGPRPVPRPRLPRVLACILAVHTPPLGAQTAASQLTPTAIKPCALATNHPHPATLTPPTPKISLISNKPMTYNDEIATALFIVTFIFVLLPLMYLCILEEIHSLPVAPEKKEELQRTYVCP
jgi:hypothetical protein